MRETYFSEEDLQNIYHLYYDEKMSQENIAKLYHTTQSVIQRRFVKEGWKTRDMCQCHRKYHLNEHLFDVIDSPDKAYCLGLWYADGCNQPENDSIKIELQSRDVDVLLKMKNFLGSDHPLKFRPADKSKNRIQDTYTLVIHSKYMCNRFNELGFVPHKSLILDFPYWMDQDLIPYMLRGYIDGDGWVQKYIVGFMSTDKFCIGVKQYLNSIGLDCSIYDMKKHYNEHTKTVNIQKKYLVPLATKMFADGSIFMQRKLDKYLEFGFLTEETNNLLSA